ncbi:hypothetical protein [Sporosarcina ureilytica]|uniref:Uncharacterized protein n=1 Tax=Sporosarcina ureilytica TaxID=298596 RepID=A0A1D8JGL0_9BACL|nr:hypothetical protein [Sporosarcina ureilytica]AOV07828.1 hypothetical protein BI350_09975 [Sporosarcina ureilytica]
MIDRTFFLTSFFSAIFMVISLKILELFDFIKWSPIGWAKNWSAFSAIHYTIKWGMLFIALFIVFAVLYILISFLDSIPPSIPAIIISILGIIVLEWFINHSTTPWATIQSISIPLLSVTAIVLRFIAGTAIFNKELSRKV